MTNDAPVFAPALSPQEGAEAATALFREVFEAEPDGVWYAPGRVNIIGEHTDYNGGLALPIALPHRAHLALRRREDRVVRLVSPQTREKVDVMDLDTIGPKGTPGEVAHWASYIAGVAWSLESDGFENLPGFDAALVSCVPLGGGLSSSAALECSAAVAIDEVAHLGLAGTAQEPDDAGRARLVTNCVRTENEMAGAPTGGMDQSASLRCREGHALELDCRDGSVTHVPFDLAAEGLALLVIDTKAKHSLDDGQYGARRAACERAAEILGVELLADIAIEDLSGALERHRRRRRRRAGQAHPSRCHRDRPHPPARGASAGRAAPARGEARRGGQAHGRLARVTACGLRVHLPRAGRGRGGGPRRRRPRGAHDRRRIRRLGDRSGGRRRRPRRGPRRGRGLPP